MKADAFPPELARRTSPVTEWLGMRVLWHDDATKTTRFAFDPAPETRNITGNVQGGILVAMLDNAMGFNSFVSLGMVNQQTTIDIQTQFLDPVPLGPVEVEAKLVKGGRTLVFLEASLFTRDGTLAARATSTMKIRPMPKGEAGRPAGGLPA